MCKHRRDIGLKAKEIRKGYQPTEGNLNPLPPPGGSGLPSKPPGNANSNNTAQQTSTPAGADGNDGKD